MSVVKEITHDYRPSQLRWGWTGLTFDINSDKKTALMTGIGRGIEAGHYIIVTQGQTDYAYLVERIAYDTNPTDFYNANIRIVGTWED